MGAALALLAPGFARAAEADTPQPEAVASGAYEFGRGLRLGDSGITLGGYATLEYRHEESQPEQLRASHASLFIWWEGFERAKVFAEIDLLNALSHQDERSRYDERRVSLERLYGDYSLGEALTLRAGKFLSPIGRWNQVHAEPLVWTTSAPLITQAVFPRNVTGVSAWGRWHGAGRSWSYAVYASDGSEWRADREQDPFSRVRGLRLTMDLSDELQLGLSVAHYALASLRAESRRLGGLDLAWQHRGFEISAEWLRTNRLSGQWGSWGSGPVLPPWVGGGSGMNPGGPGNPTNPTTPGTPGGGITGPPSATTTPRRTEGSFVQGVAPVGAGWYAVLRSEWLSDARWSGHTRRWVLGAVWRPHPGTVFKLEWAQDNGSRPLRAPTLASSLSVLF